MSVKPFHIKTAVKLLCLALCASMMIASVCFADDDEDDGLPKGSYSLGQERPKPQPKPKVIIKEKIVVQCPPGSNWNTDVKRCQNEDGEDIAPAPKAKKKPQPRVAEEQNEPAPPQRAKVSQVPDDKYIFPRTKVRVRPGQCIMTGESMTCDITYINTAEGQTRLTSDKDMIIDNLGNKFLATSGKCGGNGSCYVKYGNSLKHSHVFTYLDSRATSVTFTSVIHANGETDLIKLENFPITK